VHLKSYKYSSVDKSLISNYILKHYVFTLQLQSTPLTRGRTFLREPTVECICGTSATMACTEYGHIAGILLYPDECDLFGDMDAGLGRTGMSGTPQTR
jgi:hypothetical protein